MERDDLGKDRSGVLALAVLLANFAAATAWTWMRLYNTGIDYGRELYVPWRLTRGEQLYQQIDSLYGPLASLLNAGFFALFGFSPGLLAVLNVLGVGVFLVFFFSWARGWIGPWLALLLGVCFVHLFAFANFGPTGNFNFIMPYSHDAVYGFYALAGMVGCLTPRDGRVSTWRTWGAGFCFGLVWLTKVELLLAAGVGLAIWVILYCLPPARNPLRPLWGLVGGGLLVMGLFLSVMAWAGYEPQVWVRALGGSFRLLIDNNPFDLDLYRGVTGMDVPIRQGGRLVQNSLTVGLLVSASLVAAWPPSGLSKWKKIMLVVALVTVALVLPESRLQHLGKACLFWVALATALVLLNAWRGRRFGEPGVRAFLLCAGVALALQAKVLFNTGIYYYGFTLSTGVFALFVLLLFRLPEWAGVLGWNFASSPGWGGRRYRTIILVALLGFVGIHISLTVASGSKRTAHDLRPGWQSLVYDPGCTMSRSVFAAADWVDRHVSDTETLAVLPQGVMVNVLTRRRNSVPYLHLLPPELKLFGRHRTLEAFQRHPPDWIMFVPDNPDKTGEGFFGIEASFPEFLVWMKNAYERVDVFFPAGNGGPAVGCWKKKDPLLRPLQEDRQNNLTP